MEPNQAQTPEATPASVPVEPTQAAPASAPITTPEGQAPAQPQAPQNAFTNVDPATLTPQDQETYKNMQADYTRKMQEISQQAQQYQQYEQYLPVLQAMAQHQPGQSPVNPVVDGIISQLREAGYDDNSIQVGKIIAENLLNYNQQEKTIEQTYNKVTTEFAQAAKMDPRLEDPNLVYEVDGEKQTFGQVVEKLVSADPNWHQKPLVSVQKAIKTVDAMINSAKTQGKQELSKQTQTKAQSFAPVSSSPQGTAKGDGSMSIREAIEAATKQATAS